MQSHDQKSFESFDDYIDGMRSQIEHEAPVDIREEILAIKDRRITIGYTEANLAHAYPANLRRLFPGAVGWDHPKWRESEVFLVSGIMSRDPSIAHKGSLQIFRDYELGMRLIFMEQGFLASSHSWSEAFKQQDPQMACLGYVYDDVSHYFMADYPNRLIQRLNSSHELTPQDVARARANMNRIVEARISKYNSQPIYSPTFSAAFSKRVLVCDQSYADASTVYGKVGERDFERMLLDAIRENPDAEILVKTHPDTHWESGKRTGYYSDLVTSGRVTVIRNPLNPFSLFECVDKVYVATSQMGIEALFAGKEVVCYGAPFYAGWGLTDDRQPVSHRRRQRTLEDLFHYFYHWYTIYNVPGCERPASVEDALDYIEANRPVLHRTRPQSGAVQPKVSVIVPVYGVERYIKQCIESIQGQTLSDIEIITVNDKSPDGSQAIIDEMAATDSRIRPLVLGENVGQGFARNKGLEVATGDYVFFLDSDDYFARPRHLERAVATALADDAEMVRGRKILERVEDREGRFVRNRPDTTEEFFDKDFHAASLATRPTVMHSRHFFLWLYERSFLEENHIRFLTPQWEERTFLLKALLEARRISSITSEAIIYRVRQDSTARRRKGASDYFNQLESFGAVISHLEGAGAFEHDSALRYHARFQMTQYLHYIFLGFSYKMVQNGEAPEPSEVFLSRVANAFRRTGIRPKDLVFDSVQLSKAHINTGAYALILAAVLANEESLVHLAVHRAPVDQADYMRRMLEEPATVTASDLQVALNSYAKNGRIRTSDAHAEQGLARSVRLVVHLGTTKTGTTSIQHMLDENRPSLLRRGIWFPEVGLVWQKDRAYKTAGHARFAAAAKHGDPSLKRHLLAGVNLSQSRIHTIVISSEAYFLNRTSIALVDYFSDFQLEMIVYFRRQDDWANSQYAEFVAGGAVNRVQVPIDEWLETLQTRERLDYLGLLDHWAQRLPLDNIHVRIFEPERLVGGDALTDFLKTLSLEALDLPRPQNQLTNQFLLESQHVEIIRHYNSLDWPDPSEYLRFIELATSRILAARQRDASPMTKPNLLSDEQRKKILEECSSANSLLSERYLAGGPVSPFSPPSPRTEPNPGVVDVNAFQIIEESYREIVRARKPSEPKEQNGKQRRTRTIERQKVATESIQPRARASDRHRAKGSNGQKTRTHNSNREHSDSPQLRAKNSNHQQAESWNVQAKNSNGQKTTDLNAATSTNDGMRQSAVQTREVRNEELFRVFDKLVGTFATPQKLRKLRQHPDRFFEDSRKFSIRVIGRILLRERRGENGRARV